MKGLVYQTIDKYIVTVKCNGPLHIGSAVGGPEEVLIHPVSGQPFVQASSIAGVLRSYYKAAEEKTANRLFGSSSQENQSRVRVTDGEFNGTVKMELRPNVRINRQTGSVASEKSSGQKFNTLYIGDGAEFTFSIYCYLDGENKDLEEKLKEILAALRDGSLRFGAKKSSGGGSVNIKKIMHKEFDLSKDADRKDWMKEENLKESSYELNYEKKLPAYTDKMKAYSICITGETEGTIQVKAITPKRDNSGHEYASNMQNVNKDYIIPGSSLKGALRSRMEMISEYLHVEKALVESFGTENTENGNTGNLVFADTVIGDRASIDNIPPTHRIHIDKFTGGVFNQGLFTEHNAAGTLNMKIDIMNRNYPEATLGLLVFALRDLANGSMNLGSGYSIGKGIVKVDRIEINRCGDNAKTVISFKGSPSIEDPKQMLAEAFAALKQMEA